MRDAIARDNHPRTIFAFMTMDEYGRLGAVFQNGECFLYLLLRGCNPALELQVNIAHTQRFDYFPFPGSLLGGRTEVQNRLNAKLGQHSKPVRCRLTATENLWSHLLKIGYVQSVLANRTWPCAERNPYGSNSQPLGVCGQECVVHAFSIASKFQPARQTLTASGIVAPDTALHLSSIAPTDGRGADGERVPERDNALLIAAGPRFFATLEMPLMVGSDFNERDRGPGLKLTKSTSSEDTLVIDHIEKVPTEN